MQGTVPQLPLWDLRTSTIATSTPPHLYTPSLCTIDSVALDTLPRHMCRRRCNSRWTEGTHLSRRPSETCPGEAWSDEDLGYEQVAALPRVPGELVMLTVPWLKGKSVGWLFRLVISLFALVTVDLSWLEERKRWFWHWARR
jgi:hypothetical protein